MLLSSLLSVLLISTLPNLILILVPISLLNGSGVKSYINFQNILLCFASGGLLGDVFLHILPHLLLSKHHDHHDHHEHHDHHDHHEQHEQHNHHDNHSKELYVGLLLLLGFLLFLITERVSSIHHHHLNHHHHKKDANISDTMTKETPLFPTQTSSTSPSLKSRRGRSRSPKHIASSSSSSTTTLSSSSLKSKKSSKILISSPPPPPSSSSSSSSSSTTFFSSCKKLSTVGILNIVADSLHNFTDGLALGSAFASSSSSSSSIAFATVMSILIHEIPHEIGDFTILVNSGFSKYEAIRAQFVTALAAILGTIIGSSLAQYNNTVGDVIIAMTSGGFLYISTVGMLPMLSKKDTNLLQVFYESLGFILGVVLMAIVMLYE